MNSNHIFVHVLGQNLFLCCRFNFTKKNEFFFCCVPYSCAIVFTYVSINFACISSYKYDDVFYDYWNRSKWRQASVQLCLEKNDYSRKLKRSKRGKTFLMLWMLIFSATMCSSCFCYFRLLYWKENWRRANLH